MNCSAGKLIKREELHWLPKCDYFLSFPKSAPNASCADQKSPVEENGPEDH